MQRQLIVARDKEAEARADGNRLYAKSEEAYLAEDYAHAYDFLVATYEIKAYPQLKYDMAQCLRKLGGRREEAIRLYKEFLASGTGTPEHQKKATEYVAELTGPGPSGDAAKDATIGGVLYGKSEDAYRAGDYAHAYDFLRQTYDIKAYPQLKYDMAQCLRKLGGRREEAIRLYKEFLASGTGTPEHQKKAKEYVAELTGPGPSGDAAKDAAIGGVLYGKSEHAYLAGDYAHAYDFLRQTYEIKPYPQLKYDMAQCLRKLGGRREEAIRLYKEFLASGTGSPDHQRMARVYLRELVTQGASYS